MTKRSQAEPVETQYEDHKIIVPPHTLKTAIVHTSEPGDIAMDVVQKAEEALAQLKNEFGDWMQAECDQLDSARSDIHKSGPNATNLLLLFRSGSTHKDFAQARLEPLSRLPLRLLGAVLNDFQPDRLGNNYYSSYYGNYLPGYEAGAEEEERALEGEPA